MQVRIHHETSTGCTITAEPGERIGHCDPVEVRDLLRRRGTVYFSGFSTTMAEYQEYTERFGRCATPRVIHYPPGGVALGFHAEDSYNPWRPDALWFLCLAAGSDGGTPTGVVDGVQLLDDLGEPWRTYCLENRIKFSRQWPASSWQEAIGGGHRRAELAAFLGRLPGLGHAFDPDGTLHTRFETSMAVTAPSGQPSLSNTMLHAITDEEFYGMTLLDGSPVPEELLTRIEKLALENEIGVGWSDGDVAIVDNHRMMHRRAEYSGTDRDLRVVHGEEFFGSVMPPATTELEQTIKQVLQGEEDLR